MDKWQALCGELVTFQTSGARQQADEARAKEADLKGQLAEKEQRSRELEAQAEKASKRVANLDDMLKCAREAQNCVVTLVDSCFRRPLMTPAHCVQC
jgi:chromosome segregation ATPase